MDILWGGTPMLTLAGETLASRVSSSLVVTMGFPELMCTNMAEYEEKAVHWATHTSELRELQTRIRAARATSPLFNTRQRVRHLEAAFLAMMRRWLEGLAPTHMNIDEAMKRTTSSDSIHSSTFKRTRSPASKTPSPSMGWT